MFPVENGLELVVDSTDERVLAEAIVAVATAYPGHVTQQEWVLATGDVILLVPAPVEAMPTQREHSLAEETARAAHPAGKGRRQA